MSAAPGTHMSEFMAAMVPYSVLLAGAAWELESSMLPPAYGSMEKPPLCCRHEQWPGASISTPGRFRDREEFGLPGIEVSPNSNQAAPAWGAYALIRLVQLHCQNLETYSQPLHPIFVL